MFLFSVGKSSEYYNLQLVFYLRIYSFFACTTYNNYISHTDEQESNSFVIVVNRVLFGDYISSPRLTVSLLFIDGCILCCLVNAPLYWQMFFFFLTFFTDSQHGNTGNALSASIIVCHIWVRKADFTYIT